MTSKLSAFLLSLLAVTAGACSSSSSDDAVTGDDRCDDGDVVCSAYGRKGFENRAPAYELGDGAKAPTLTVIFEGIEGVEPVDLEFNPRRTTELWVTNYATGHMSILTNPGEASQSVREVRDPAYSHYMYAPPAFAFGTVHADWGQQFAVCGDGNNFGNYFMGPTLFSADESIFGYQTSGGLGTHLDMLHSTPYCRGLAWAGTGNQYWVFNAHAKSVDFYDFVEDHGPGNTDHSDGVIRSYWKNQVEGVDGVVSHVSFDTETKKLYVADTGHSRILVLDPTGGRFVAPMQGAEIIAERSYFETAVNVLVDPGVLQQPAGIEASGGLAFVTDAATSTIYAFKLQDGSLVRKLETNLAPGSLAGLNFGPEGKIYFVDRKASRVYRIDP